MKCNGKNKSAIWKNLFKVKIKTPKQIMRLTKKLLKCRNNMNKHNYYNYENKCNCKFRKHKQNMATVKIVKATSNKTMTHADNT